MPCLLLGIEGQSAIVQVDTGVRSNFGGTEKVFGLGTAACNTKGYEDLYLYLVVSPHAVSSALVQRKGAEDQPIYYSSKMLLPAQTRYLLLEQLVLPLVLAARKLLPYFQTHLIVVLTEFLLKALFRKADLSNRVSPWAVELANFDIQYEPWTAIKAQVLADFIAELTPGAPTEQTEI